MSLEQFAQLSNYTMVAATCVLALAFVCHVADWAMARKVEREEVTERDQAWVVSSGASVSPENNAVPDSDASYSISERFQAVGVSLSVLATGLLILSTVTRGFAAERVPWGNMYEFGLAGTTIAMIVYLLLVKFSDAAWLGGIVTGFGLVVLGMSISTYVPAGPLVPSLHSYWLVIHVAAVMIAGALFLIGAAASLLYLIKARAEKKNSVGPVLSRFPGSAAIDQIAYRVNAAGFPLWTFGALIAGPIWAHYAWGRFWGWDPKEVWALITWIVYAGYLHARATAGWKGQRAAIICFVGFVTFLFSYYGVNLLGSGLHTYAK